ncbi:unnamed protein product [Didymodactylos carnosus]|uniref:Uncharacterized protein n=1 Tax=Didymodactylos carnosus TaxID=1234261 RepID=A0A815RW84_9BILA|nr:unnamed protein product [Didymodactylos carnosus]CAF4347902.1 unnamed protein product [Didymodactylos carnosus]
MQRTAGLQMYASLSKKYKNAEWNEKKHGYVPIVQLMERVYQKPQSSDLKRLENSLLKPKLNLYIGPLELKP